MDAGIVPATQRLRFAIALAAILSSPVQAYAYKANWEVGGFNKETDGPGSYAKYVDANGPRYVSTAGDFYYWLQIENSLKKGGTRNQWNQAIFKNPDDEYSVGLGLMDITFTPDSRNGAISTPTIPIFSISCGPSMHFGGKLANGQFEKHDCFMDGAPTQSLKANLYRNANDPQLETYSLTLSYTDTISTEIKKIDTIITAIATLPALAGSPYALLATPITKLIEAIDDARTDKSVIVWRKIFLKPQGTDDVGVAGGATSIRFFKTEDEGMGGVRIYIQRSASLLLDKIPRGPLLAETVLLTDLVNAGDAFGAKFAQYKGF